MSSRHQIAKRQQWEMLLGFLAFFTVAALVWAVVSIATGAASLWASLALIVLLVADWLVWRKM